MTPKPLNRELTEAEINYVFIHLSHHIKTDYSLNYLIGYHSIPNKNFKGIEIYKSNKNISITTFEDLSEIPILFPGNENDSIYQTENNKVIINHDLIKSSFYLLSAYQEHECSDLDQYCRFKWENSIQKKLNINSLPIVNQYFEWIIEAIILYCKANNINYERTNPLGKATLHLTHDIDLLRYFSWRKIAYRWAQVIGLKKCDTNKKRLFKAAYSSLLSKLNISKMNNPYWSFAKILNTERYYGYKSSWFFLPKVGGIFDADYKIIDKDVNNIIQTIAKLNCDIGLHASLKTESTDDYLKEYDIINTSSCCQKICRSHFLKYNYDITPNAMQNAYIEADCSFGFSECEGYRNSYCFPFFPFDHKKQKVIQIIEIPLIVMDTTLLAHKKMNYNDIYDSIEMILEQTRKYGGIFSLLWHNSTFDEAYYPGIDKFYEQLHHFFSQYNLQSLTTSEIIVKMHKALYIE